METNPVIGRGRGAKLKHLYLKKEENPVTHQIRSLFGDAHFVAMKGVDGKKSETNPVIGRGRGAKFKHLYLKKEENPVTHQIRSAFGDAHFVAMKSVENKISPLKIDGKVRTATKRKTVAQQLIEWLAIKKTSVLEKTKATAEAGVIKLPKKKYVYEELINETDNTVSSEVCSSLSSRLSMLESRMEETFDIVCEIRDFCNNSAAA